jgi:hypothetical protein
MALASFFDRAATAASQVLQGFNLDSFRGFLSLQSVLVAFDETATQSPEGKVTLELIVNLLARLYPTIGVRPLHKHAKNFAEELSNAALLINPEISFISRPRKHTVVLVVGNRTSPTESRPIYLGSKDWVAKLSTHKPLGSGNSSNPFGAAAAACFGAANVFRTIFADQLPNGKRDDAINFSLLSLRHDEELAASSPIPEIELAESCIAGAGAIGNAFIWVLSRVPSLRGTLDIVDHETVELSNLQRYILTNHTDVGKPKVELAKAALVRDGFEPRAHQMRWSQYIGQSTDFAVKRLLAAVDSAEDRIAMQASLPEWICNAWTQSQDLGVSRHGFLGKDACLMCLYLPTNKQPDEDEIITTAFGLPGDAKQQIRKMLFNNEPMTHELLNQVALAQNIEPTKLQSFVGRPIRGFYVEAFCGGVIFKLSNGSHPTQAIVPMVFQSALAGIMLAAETILHATESRPSSFPPVTTINLLRPLAPYVSFNRKKAPSGRCICQDVDYISVYREKWNCSEC